MAVPKKKQSHSASRKRRSHDALSPLNLVECSSCRELILPHRVCQFCGNYGDKVVINVK